MWESQVLLTDGQVVFSPGVSGFRPPLMNDRLYISKIFLKGSTLFALISEISTKHDNLYIGNGSVQRVKVDESTRQKWVKLS